MEQLSIQKVDQLLKLYQKMLVKQGMDLTRNAVSLTNIMHTRLQKFMMFLNQVWEPELNH